MLNWGVKETKTKLAPKRNVGEVLVYVTTSKEGYHYWKDAPSEVEFLRYPHRHLFKVKAAVKVNHSDRDVEFFILQRDLNSILYQVIPDTPSPASCEMLAEQIGQQLTSKGYAVHSVEVSEDGENGAIVFF